MLEGSKPFVFVVDEIVIDVVGSKLFILLLIK
jgi:hypothetical protein